MNHTQQQLRDRPILPLLLSMSVPVVLSMLIQGLYNIVDGIWVTKLGTQALTAVSLAFPLQNMIMSVGVGLGIGIGSVVSRELGAGSREKASRAASTGIVLVLVNCILFFLAGIYFTRPFLQLFERDTLTLNWACDYAQIVMCLSFGELLQMCLEKIFQGAGKMTATMFLMASGCLINMVLDPILIFGMFGFPAMGVRGAAAATVIGQIAAFLLYLVVCRRINLGLDLQPRYVSLSAPLIRQIYGVGIPSSLMLAMPSALTGILNGLLVRLGGVYVAVFGLYFKLQTFVTMPANGVIQGMRPIIGYNFGAGNVVRVRKTIRWSLFVVGVIMLLGTVLSVFFPRQILSIFDADLILLETGVPALRIIGLSFIISAPAQVTCGVFEALGNGRGSLLLSMLRQLVVLVPAARLLSFRLGAIGVWAAFPVAELTALILSLFLLRRAYRSFNLL